MMISALQHTSLSLGGEEGEGGGRAAGSGRGARREEIGYIVVRDEQYYFWRELIFSCTVHYRNWRIRWGDGQTRRGVSIPRAAQPIQPILLVGMERQQHPC
jgi:hypothetical protein